MAQAYKCDQCSDFQDGKPAITINLSLQVDELSLFESLLGGTGSSGESLDLCGVECLSSIGLDNRKNELLADVDKKDRMLDDPYPVVGSETPCN